MSTYVGEVDDITKEQWGRSPVLDYLKAADLLPYYQSGKRVYGDEVP